MAGAMPADGTDLRAPVLLIAMPQVHDQFFHKSVVLLVHHSDEGSFGLIVNRRTGLGMAEILEGMELEWHGDPEAVAHFGGPVQPQLGTVVYVPDPEGGDGAEPAGGTATEVCDGMWISHHVGDLGRLAESPPGAFRLVLGYAGWGAGQLLEEILRNDWITAPVRRDLVFGDDTAEVWDEALRSVGIDPGTLPAWTPEAGEGGAN
jgi:putative transcriptional regulator